MRAETHLCRNHCSPGADRQDNSTAFARKTTIGAADALVKHRRRQYHVWFPVSGRRRSPYCEAAEMHYPRRVSKKKRIRKVGFRARMRTKSGRKIINGRRRARRQVQIV